MNAAKYETYHETVGHVILEIARYAESMGMILSDPEWLTNTPWNSLFYTQSDSYDFQLATYKNKPTRAYLHVRIYRLESGRYELSLYTL